jgi:small subunit ribosomal protein S6
MATDKLRRYELIYLVQPEADDEARETASGYMLKILEESGATVIKNEDWGKRKLAYEIDKVNKAYYNYLEFIAKPGVTHEMERVLRTNLQGVCVRYQTIKLEEGIDPSQVERYVPVVESSSDVQSESTEGV